MEQLTEQELDFIIDSLKGQASVAGISKPFILDLIGKVEEIKKGGN